MKPNHTFMGLLLLMAIYAMGMPAMAQQGKPGDRPDIQQTVNRLRAELRQHPSIMAKDKLSRHSFTIKTDSNDASTDVGGITGRIEGITEGDSAWVLVVAASLYEDPTAWHLGNVEDDGSYRVTGLRTGTYFLIAGAEGYFPQYYHFAYSAWEAIPVEVAAGEITSEIHFFLEPSVSGSGSMSGVVLSETTQEPIPGAYVQAYSRGNPFGNASVRVNDDGSYTLTDLRPGDYYVTAYAEGYFSQTYGLDPATGAGSPVRVENDAETTGIDFALNEGGTITGRVVDGDGNPMANVSIEAYPAYDDPYNETGDSLYIDPDYGYSYGWAATDDDGFFRVTGLYTGRFIVSAYASTGTYSLISFYDNVYQYEEATPVEVILGEETSNIDFTFDFTTDVGAITGRVTNADGEPVQYAQLRLESIEQRNFYYYAYVSPDESGFYAFEGVPTGTYRVVLEYWTESFYDIVWYKDARTPEDATPVVVEVDQRTADIDFVLPKSDGVISGKVVDSQGNPVPNAYIQLHPSSNDGMYREYYYWTSANTDADGNYRIENLIDGEYTVSLFFCYFFECSEQWWPNAMSPDEAEAVVVRDGQSNPASVDFTLDVTLGTSSISGTITSASTNEPLAGAYVTVMPYESITPDGGAPDIWTTPMQTYTDSSGGFSFNALPAGTFIVFASYWQEGGYAELWYENATSPADASPIILNDGDSVEGIDFSLDFKPFYGSLEGRIEREDGVALGRAMVRLNPHYDDYQRNTATDIAIIAEWYTITDDDGSFSLEYLPEGTYSIDVYAQGASLLLTDETGINGQFVEIYGGERSEVALLMRPQTEGSASMSGIVLGEEGNLPEISVVVAIPSTDGPGDPFYTAIPDEAGVYQFAGIPEGAYYVQAMAPYFLTEYFNDAQDPDQAELVEIGENQPADGIDFFLSTLYYIADEGRNLEGDFAGAPGQTSAVQGTVMNEQGQALAMATVYLVDDQGEAILSAETLADGSYLIDNIIPGSTYRLKATRPGYETRFNGDERQLENASALTMNSGSYEHNFTLSLGQVPTNEEETPGVPESFATLGNYPNPFAQRTAISMTLPQSRRVIVTVYDALGREVDRIFDGSLGAGTHQIAWDVTSSEQQLPSGLYFYRISDGDQHLTGKMLLIK